MYCRKKRPYVSWLIVCTSASNSFSATSRRAAPSPAGAGTAFRRSGHRRSASRLTHRPSTDRRGPTTDRGITRCPAATSRGAAAPTSRTTTNRRRHRRRVTWSVWRHRRLPASCPFPICSPTSNRDGRRPPNTVLPLITWHQVTWRHVAGRKRK